jgi:hypothetical protein
MAVQNESIAGKCSRLLKASRTPPVSNLRVDWAVAPDELQDDFEVVDTPSVYPETPTVPPSMIDLYDNSYNPLDSSDQTGAKPSADVILAPSPLLQQAPHSILAIYPGNRFIVSAIISSDQIIPDSVVLQGDLPSGQKLNLKVEVQKTTNAATPPLIHTLAARRLIQDLEDGKAHPQALNANEVDPDAVVKAAIVKLGVEYQLTSKYTSFVAVDESKRDELPQEEIMERSAVASRNRRSRSRSLSPQARHRRHHSISPPRIAQAVCMVADSPRARRRQSNPSPSRSRSPVRVWDHGVRVYARVYLGLFPVVPKLMATLLLIRTQCY